MIFTDQPSTPPRQPGALGVPSRPSTWPTVLGVIAIVLGGLGALGGCWGVVAVPLMEAFLGTAPGGTVPGVALYQGWTWWIMLGSAITTCLAVLLLVSGIGMLKHLRWGVTAACWWAILKMVFVVVNIIPAYMMQQEQFEALSQQGVPAMGGGLFAVVGVFSIVFGLVWGCALPVFLLIWFARATIKAETADWS